MGDKTTLTKDHLMIPVRVLMDSLDDEAKGMLAMYLLTDDQMIEAIVGQVVDGGLDDPHGRWWSAGQGCIHEARVRLCAKLPAIAARAVKDLLHTLRASQARAREYENWAWRLWHGWRRSGHDPRPGPPKWVPTPYPTEAEVQAVLSPPEGTDRPDTIKPEVGIHRGVPEAEYRAWDAFHKSAVGALLRSPMHWAYERDHPKETAAMAFGTLVDCLLLEPETFAERYGMVPSTYAKEETKGRGANKHVETTEKPWSANSNTCKAILKDLADRGVRPISPATLARAQGAARAIKDHPLAAEWLARGQRQVSLVWTDSETGVLCKARGDLIVEPGRCEEMGAADLLMVDLKVTNDASYGAFRRTMTFLGYHIQAGLYQDGYATLHGGLNPPFYMLAVEDGPPHGVVAYPVGPDSIMTGLRKARDAMKVWEAIRQTGNLPGYPVLADEMDVLPWALDKDLGDFNG